jgi:hypothetical protein
MIVITRNDRRKWARLIEGVLMESRKGSKRAQAWFQGVTWQTVSKEMFNTKQIAEIEKQSLVVEKDG